MQRAADNRRQLHATCSTQHAACNMLAARATRNRQQATVRVAPWHDGSETAATISRSISLDRYWEGFSKLLTARRLPQNRPLHTPARAQTRAHAQHGHDRAHAPSQPRRHTQTRVRARTRNHARTRLRTHTGPRSEGASGADIGAQACGGGHDGGGGRGVCRRSSVRHADGRAGPCAKRCTCAWANSGLHVGQSGIASAGACNCSA
jgi:hypothetical protein